MKVIVEFHWDCHRMGILEGVFVCEKEDLKNIIGKEVYFGEVLGKHSSISGKLEEKDFEIKSEDPVFVNKYIEIFGEGTASGYNPFDYL